MTIRAALTESMDKLDVSTLGPPKEEQDLDEEDSAEEGPADVVGTSGSTKKKKKKRPKKKVSHHPTELQWKLIQAEGSKQSPTRRHTTGNPPTTT